MTAPTSEALTVSVFRSPAELPADVHHLFDKAEEVSMELGLGWYTNLVRTLFPKVNHARFYVLRKNGAAIAVLPLMVAGHPLWGRVNSLSNYYTALYAPVLGEGASAQDLAAVIRRVRRDNPMLACMRFAPMDPETSSYRILWDALSIASMAPFDFFCFGNWYLKAAKDWPEYLKERSGTLRSTIKRMSKKFIADGGTLEIINNCENLGAALEAYEAVYAASWKSAEPYTDFVSGLAGLCAANNWLRLGIARLNGNPIAAQLWIVAGGKADIYKVAYDENFKPYAPGTLVTAMLMQHVIEVDGVTEIDFLIGDDAYKKSWMNYRRERWGIVAYNPWSILGIVWLLRELTGRAVKSMKLRFKANRPEAVDA